MAILDPTTLDALADISSETYEEGDSSPSFPGTSGVYSEISNSLNLSQNGFEGRAYFNTARNELVIAFTGTDGLDDNDLGSFALDVGADFALAVTGNTGQIQSARGFIDEAIAEANSLSSNYSIVYTGHSLGGFLAQTASAGRPEGEVVAFNAPGAGGITRTLLHEGCPGFTS